MKIIRFEWQQTIMYGVTDAGSVFSIEGDILGDFSIGKKLCSMSDVKLLAPVQPKILVCIAANYHKGLRELGREIPGEPELFFKPASSVVGHLEDIVYPDVSKEVGIAGEVAVVMKYEARKVPVDKALDYVLGYTCVNDVMAMDLERKDRFPTRAKSYYAFCPLGPCIATDINGDDLKIRYSINDTVIADESTSDMIFNISQTISYITQFMALEPLDVVLMGSPIRNEIVKIGDTIEVEIEGIGKLRNTVIADPY